jgi:hypothetical protein
MLVILLLQAASLLPPPMATLQVIDPEYREQLLDLSSHAEVDWATLEGRRPKNSGQVAVLLNFLARGNDRQARLAAILSSGNPDSALQHALLRAACTRKATNTALPCLLAAADTPASTWPALAYLAQDPKRPLALRAAAAGRLLEAGNHGVWPFCRSVFRSGTRGDEHPPWADWKRGSRWELPKRLLLLSLNRWLQRHQLKASPLEPNAAWDQQLEQLVATEVLVHKAIAKNPSPAKMNAESYDAYRALLDLALRGDRTARLAVQWLRPHIDPVLHRDLASGKLNVQNLARTLLEQRPS